MCYNVKIEKPVKEIVDQFDLKIVADSYEPKSRITISQPLPTIIQKPEGRALEMMRFGFTPFFAKGAKLSPANAKSETVASSGMFRHAFRSQRCLIPADGFYEWIGSEKGNKKLFPITLADRDLFALAGIWDRWKTPEGEERFGVAILTCGANSDMSPFHTRQPVIMQSAEDEMRWLDPGSSVDDLASLFVPVAAGVIVPRPELAFKPARS